MESLLNILSYVFWVLLAIMILVFIHELGHFLFAKLFGMRVERFSIGFPPKIFGKRVGETEYAIGATPLGGYVKIAGMVDESLDTNDLASDPQPWEFRSKPVWQRIVVIVAGVTFNILLAILIFIGLKYAYGEDYISARNPVYVEEGTIAHQMGLRSGDVVRAVNGRPIGRFDELYNARAFLVDTLTLTVEREGRSFTYRAPDQLLSRLNDPEARFGVSPAYPALVGHVVPGSPAAAAGLQPGDRIVAVDERPVLYWDQLTSVIQGAGGRAVTVRWVRPDSAAGRASGGGPLQAQIEPQRTEGRYMIGIGQPTEAMLTSELGIEHRDFGVGEAVVEGVQATWDATAATVIGFKRIISGQENFRQSVGGPIAIAQITKKAADRGAAEFWGIVALLSITLAIMNILPIPALDGGHLVFLLYEGVTRREPSLRVRMVLQQIGMILLFAFMAFVIFNDIMKF